MLFNALLTFAIIFFAAGNFEFQLKNRKNNK